MAAGDWPPPIGRQTISRRDYWPPADWPPNFMSDDWPPGFISDDRTPHPIMNDWIPCPIAKDFGASP